MNRFFTLLFAASCLTAVGQVPADSLDYSNYEPMARAEIARVHAQFDEIANPFVAVYLGSQLHDYFYFPFQGKDGTVFDFADQDNNLGDIPFSEEDAQFEGSPGHHLVGKSFLIEWEYQQSKIVCCEGLNNTYPAMLPRIKSIALLEDH